MTDSPAISCAFAPQADTPDRIALAEELGYHRAWLYDSPALYADPWMTLAVAAERTHSIGLALGVVVPPLRHVAVTAAAAVTAANLAPGRLALGVGVGGSATAMLGRAPALWNDVIAYADALRDLMRGRTVEWDGAPIRLALTTDEAVPLLFGAEGPRGERAAHEHADGISTVFHEPTLPFEWSARVVFGTVLGPDEAPTSDRAFAAAGPGAVPAYHYAVSLGDKAVLGALPGGLEWLERVEAIPERERHLTIWEGHCTELNEIDVELVPREAVVGMTMTADAATVRDRVRQLDGHVTEVVYQPAGPDVGRELRAFAEAVL